MPNDALLSIYSKNEFTDSIASNQNNESNIWATRVYQGECLTLILKIPNKEKENIKLRIGSVNFGY
ncbi:MAG: hypothetical protein ABUT20_57425, partial [Bacteroidota bacterium]